MSLTQKDQGLTEEPDSVPLATITYQSMCAKQQCRKSRPASSLSNFQEKPGMGARRGFPQATRHWYMA